MQALQSTLQAFSKTTPKYRNAVSARKATGLRIRQRIKAATTLLNERLDTLMRQFQTRNPEFYNAYRISRKIIHYGIRHQSNYALTSHVVTAGDGHPIANATARLVQQHRTDKTTKGGNFTFKQTREGTDTLEVTAPGCRPFRQEVALSKGRPLHLRIVLQAEESWRPG